MQRDFFIGLEQLKHGSAIDLGEVIAHLAFNEQGLIPVISQDASSGEVLMFAWMNQAALLQTLATQRMTYWSRSRQQLWVKGESSGHCQQLIDMSFDCDGDVVLCRIQQQGPACHTGRPSCFYLDVEHDAQQVIVKGEYQVS
ncbi:phosphoribosyl-AMP cyclohydrolase [Motilimonas pumila]|uniref:Phosphoribosyl-AMP cyclohydrolase n=1 Tax=Motilimonas pumila TaxID=2303987 RepID=A0A418YE34_9GAMM|nr:phosphoribosyl-AMP cyclohydrolase [Motilimonas pumila]RJG47421.1 phosphoribosyl-AMP cyclohydrolase [Motilimonas pumila]